MSSHNLPQAPRGRLLRGIAAWLAGMAVMALWGGALIYIFNSAADDMRAGIEPAMVLAGAFVLMSTPLFGGWVALRLNRGWGVALALSASLLAVYFIAFGAEALEPRALGLALALSGLCLIPVARYRARARRARRAGQRLEEGLLADE